MFTGALLSNAIALFLAPLMDLTALLLAFLVFFSPVTILRGRVALANVGPPPGEDGPALLLGPLGSCSRIKDAAPFQCTTAAYDLAGFPSFLPRFFALPLVGIAGAIAVSLGFSIIFFLTYICTSFRHKLGNFGEAIGKPWMQRLNAWVGVLSIVIGVVPFLFLRIWLGKAVDDVNAIAQMLDDVNSVAQVLKWRSPLLVAHIGNGFTMLYVAYIFHTIPVAIALARRHVLATHTK